MEKKSKSRGGGTVFKLKDNTHASSVKSIPTNSEQYDTGVVEKKRVGSKGYPAQAWNYKY